MERILRLGIDPRPAVDGARKFEQATNVAKSASRSLADEAERTAKTQQDMSKAVTNAYRALVASGVIYATKEMFNLGAAVEETASKFGTVLGPETARVSAFIEQFGVVAGLSNMEAQELLATTAAMAQGMGFTQRASADFATEVTKLAGDLSSFNNIPIEETSRAIQAAITGEREQLKRLGIVIRETDVQKQALAETGKANVAALTDEERAAATLTLIYDRAGVAVGDLGRTQDSAANQARALRAELENVRQTLATALLPVLSAGVTGLRKFVGGMGILGAEAAVLVARLNVMKEGFFGTAESEEAAALELFRMMQAAEEVKNGIVGLTFNLEEYAGTMAGGERSVAGATGIAKAKTDELVESLDLLTTKTFGLETARRIEAVFGAAFDRIREEAERLNEDIQITLFTDLRPHTPGVSGGGGGGGLDLGGLLGDFAGGLGLGGPFGGVVSAALGGGLKDVVGSVLGSVGSLVGGLFGASKEAEEAARRMEQATADFTRAMNDAAASLNAEGTDGAFLEDLRQQVNRWREGLEELGIDAGSAFSAELGIEGMLTAMLKLRNQFQVGTKEFDAIDAVINRFLATVNREARQQAEESARAFEELAAAMKRASEATGDVAESLFIRGLEATGQGDAAARQRLWDQHRRERRDFTETDPAMIALLDFVQQAERDALEMDIAVREQTEAITEALEAQTRLLDEQIGVARDALESNEEQVRTTERSIAELQRLVGALDAFGNDLVAGPGTPLSPVSRLQSAEAQFEALRSLALAGDRSAGQSIMDAARNFLDASEDVNARGPGFFDDFMRVQQTIADLERQFGATLSTEEMMLEELVRQSDSLRAQIESLEDAKRQAEADAQRQIQALEEARRQAMEDARAWLEELRRQTDILRRIELGVTSIDPPPPPPIFDLPVVTSAIQQGNQNVVDSVNRVSGNLAGLALRLDRVESAVQRNTSDVRVALEGARL